MARDQMEIPRPAEEGEVNRTLQARSIIGPRIRGVDLAEAAIPVLKPSLGKRPEVDTASCVALTGIGWNGTRIQVIVLAIPLEGSVPKGRGE